MGDETVAEDHCMHFERFWSAYPRRVAKGAAKKKFDALTKDFSAEELKDFTDELVNAIDAQKRNRKELEASGQFVPQWKHATTWLNGQCWTDEIKSVSEIREEQKERTITYCTCGQIATQQENLCPRCWTDKHSDKTVLREQWHKLGIKKKTTWRDACQTYLKEQNLMSMLPPGLRSSGTTPTSTDSSLKSEKYSDQYE